jgi:hypothetical protein
MADGDLKKVRTFNGDSGGGDGGILEMPESA